MKNIHIIPTDKSGRVGRFVDTQELILRSGKDIPRGENVNIYITSDEVIRDDDWVYCPVLKKPVFICLDSILMFKNLDYDSNGNSKYKKEWLKKIILTTDPDLIKDGVQAIDDEFLEWFVNNPSCEEIELEEIEKYKSTTYDQPDRFIGYDYKIIIPKEEPKQETPEEAAERFYPIPKGGSMWMPSRDDLNKANKQEGFIEGTKWQAERMYSEEEVFNLCREFAIFVQRNGPSYTKQQEWFEQFKKK